MIKVYAPGVEVEVINQVVTPPPPPPPAPPPPAPPPPTDFQQYIPWDRGDGPTRDYWSHHLLMKWKNPNVGDWIDRDGVKQGTNPYASTYVDKELVWFELDVTALINKFITTGRNKGIFLRSDKVDGVKVSGRLGFNKPELVLNGSTKPPLNAFARFSTSSSAGLDSTQSVNLVSAGAVIIHFDLKGITTPVVSAVLRLYAEDLWSGKPTITAFECDAPEIVIGSSNPVPGLAAAVGSEAALKNHPSVLRAGDFSDIRDTYKEGGTVFDTVSRSLDAETGLLVGEQLPDPDFPGTTMFRGYFRQGAWDEGDKRGSSSFKTEHMNALVSQDPMGSPSVVEEEMFARLYFYLEDDWNSVRDSNKMALGWDLRLGWWNPAAGGYWQSVTGNGGAKGDGRRRIVSKKSVAMPLSQQNEYWGHSIRMEAGKASATGNPYAALRPIQSYAYHIDQETDYGTMFRLGNVCIQKKRWFCIEQQIKMNSLTGPADSLGNREAVPDGILRTWLDGEVCDERTNLRFRRHPSMGIQGPWINWFYGGKQPSEMKMHYRMNNLVVAREYIGQRVGA
jgi:hypothetical protein